MKYFWILLVMVLVAGCHTKKASVTDNGVLTEASSAVPERDVILFLTGKMAYDSLSATYQIEILKQQRFDGRMNLEKNASEEELQGLNYQQKDAAGKVLSQHKMENPLVREIEYPDGDRFSMKTVVQREAPLYMRVQLNPRTREIVFRNGKERIETLKIGR